MATGSGRSGRRRDVVPGQGAAQPVAQLQDADRTEQCAHRRARHLFPRQMRRGRNDHFFDVVTQTEHRRGGTKTPDLSPTAG